MEVGLEVVQRLERGEWLLRPQPAIDPIALLERIGQTPLPPYIQRPNQPTPQDRTCYQTVYAERPGAVAAPTAGLHFTPAVLEELADRGVRRVTVTLHVGAGTFVPISADDLADHEMHAEWYEITPAAMDELRATRSAGGRIVAVGTTAARVLESLPADTLDAADPPTQTIRDWTRIFIYPPYEWRHVDRLLTNFHLPGSTLLALVQALAGQELIRRAYREAVDRRYRFYSYGDAMLIL